MTQERAFQFSSILLAATGFGGLVLTGEMPLGLVLLGSAALVLSLAHAWDPARVAGSGLGRILFTLPRQVWNGLVIAAFLAFLADFFWLSQDLLPAGIHFLILLMVNKLLTLQVRKDFLYLYAISLLELLAAAVLTVDLWYAAVFITYLLAAIWTLLLYHLRTEAEERRAVLAPAATGSPRQPGHQADPVHEPGPITARFFWTTNGIAAGAFCVTLAIFFVTPRIGAGFFSKNRMEQIRTSGFSEQVDLGVIGTIKLSQSVVMRVEFPDQQGPPPAGLYFRGAAYDRYNGRSWVNSLARRRVLERTQEGFLTTQGQVNSRIQGSQAGFRQEILIEALDTTALFGVSFVDSVMGNFSMVQVDGMGGLSLPYPPSRRFQYSVRSTPDRLLDEERQLVSLTYPDDVSGIFLQLPNLSPRVGDLARDVTSRARTPYEKVIAVERHLREAYQYSLDVGTAVPLSPLEEFLFTRKTGYCEHYATAMVIMLRSLGIPARLTTGFLPGEWNDFGRYYTIRQRDAHAWVEVFFPRSGWVTFDPTPAVPPAVSDQALTAATKVLDSIRLKWDRLIIRYSFRDQVAVAQGIRARSDRIREQAWELLTTLVRWPATLRSGIGRAFRATEWVLVGGLLTGLGILALVAVAWPWIRGKTAHRHPGLPTARQASAVRFYSRMLKILEGYGVRKAPGTTALEFSRLVALQWGEASHYVEPLTDLYCRVRFGQAPLPPEELQRAEALLSGLRSARR
jgi:transglutaminase-like putative cysteine protease